jgi:hypothetical protein
MKSPTEILVRAAEILEREAAALGDKYAFRGRWIFVGDEQAKRNHDEMRESARGLRELAQDLVDTSRNRDCL